MASMAVATLCLAGCPSFVSPVMSKLPCQHSPVRKVSRTRTLRASISDSGSAPTRIVENANPTSGVAGRMESSSSGSGSRQDLGEVGEADVVVIGAGIGGLCCAGLLARYGLKVVVLESHDVAGGAGHAFTRQGYQFDSGPSFHAGLSTKPSINPLKQEVCFVSKLGSVAHANRQVVTPRGPKGAVYQVYKKALKVLDALDEEVECVQYKTWVGYLPEGIFNFTAERVAYTDMIRRAGGPQAAKEWTELELQMAPLAKAAMGLPAAALRPDPAVVLTAARFLPQLLPYVPYTKDLLAPFSKIVDQTVKDPFLRRLIDLECFVLSGLLADSTITAEMVTMFTERHRAGGTIDYPMGGGGAIIDALVRGLNKFGGQLRVNSHVESILVENGRAVGVTFNNTRGSKKGRRSTIRARKAVISNASVWDTARLLPSKQAESFSFIQRADEIPKTESFVHLHLGIDASGLPSDLDCHHLILNDWAKGVGAPQNVCLVSIPSVFDSSLAPAGHHVVHAYTAGNEPYDIWKGMDRKSPQYAALKEERSQCLWEALEKVIPDIRERVKLKLVGTPLTHERYLRRSEGTYGPAIRAGKGSWPGPFTEIPGLLVCGDSTMPGIGVPAVAASGMIAANSLVPFWQQWGLLSKVEAVL